MLDKCRNTCQMAASCCLANSSDDPVCPGSCAEHKYQPRALKVWHGFDALQEEAVFLELGFHELLTSQGVPNTTVTSGDLGACGRHATEDVLAPGGKKPPLLNNCVLPKLMRMPA